MGGIPWLGPTAAPGPGEVGSVTVKAPWLLVHGFAGGPSVFDPLVASLGTDTEVQRFTLPGHGLPPTPPVIDFEGAVARLVAELEVRERTALLGYSMGGRLALGAALAAPERVSRLVLVGVSAGLGTQTQRFERRGWELKWGRILRREGMEAFVDGWQAQPLFASQGSLPPEVWAAQRAVRLAHDPQALADALDSLGTGAMPFLLPHLYRYRGPVELVVGEHDTKYVEIGQSLVRSLVQGRLHVMEGCGHNVVLEDPDAVARKMVPPAGTP